MRELQASFTNSKGGPINPFTGKPVQPPSGLSKAQRLKYIRDRTHVVLEP
jgi:filamentous hemagglutinin